MRSRPRQTGQRPPEGTPRDEGLRNSQPHRRVSNQPAPAGRRTPAEPTAAGKSPPPHPARRKPDSRAGGWIPKNRRCRPGNQYQSNHIPQGVLLRRYHQYGVVQRYAGVRESIGLADRGGPDRLLVPSRDLAEALLWDTERQRESFRRDHADGDRNLPPAAPQCLHVSDSRGRSSSHSCPIAACRACSRNRSTAAWTSETAAWRWRSHSANGRKAGSASSSAARGTASVLPAAWVRKKRTA